MIDERTAQHLADLQRQLPQRAYCMRGVLDYLARHPGATKSEVRGSGFLGRNGDGEDALHRLRRRGMVYNLGRDNRHAWYLWTPPEPAEPGTWATEAHP